jgi:hypothetical protein
MATMSLSFIKGNQAGVTSNRLLFTPKEEKINQSAILYSEVISKATHKNYIISMITNMSLSISGFTKHY